MSNSSGCPRMFSGINRTLLVLLVIVVLEFMVVRWYYKKPDQSRQRVLLSRGQHLNMETRGRGITPSMMSGIDYAVSQIKIRMLDKEHSGFLTWPERPLQGTSQTNRCQYYNDVAKAKRIVMKNILGTPMPNQRDVTIVTQASLGHLDRVKRLLDHWEGPVSVAVHVRPVDVSQLSYYLVTLAANATNMQRLAMHLVFDPAPTDNYPINYLRDVAFNSSTTDRLFLLDAEFVTSKGLHKELKYCDLGNREAVVVPAFQIDQQQNRNVKIETSEELKSAWQRRIVQPFMSREFPQGQRATRYSNWRVATKKYMITYELLYAPYVLVQKRKGIPHYDPRFMNADWDRTSHIYALKRSRYKFTVLPKVFVLHYSLLSARTTYSKYKECSRAIWARVTNTNAMEPETTPSAVKWKSQVNIDPPRIPVGQQSGRQDEQQSGDVGQRSEQFGKRGEQFGQQRGEQSGQQLGKQFGQQRDEKPGQQRGEQFGQQLGKQFGQQRGKQLVQQQGEHFGQRSEQFGKGRKGKTDDIGLGVKERKPYFSETERLPKGQNGTNVKERKPSRSEMEKIQKYNKYNEMVGGEERNPKFSERNPVHIITTDVKSNKTGRKSISAVMSEKKKENNTKVSEQKERSPFSRIKQDPNAKNYMKTMAEARKHTYAGIEKIQENKENGIKLSLQDGRSPFSKMDGTNSDRNLGKRKERYTKRSIKDMRGLDQKRLSKETNLW